MKDLLANFTAAADIESFESFEAALRAFAALKEVKGNGRVEYGFITKVVKPIGVAVGLRLAESNEKARSRWLKRLATDEKAAARCMACFVLGEFGKVKPSPIVETAHRLAADDRWEVRECIANAFDDQIGLTQPEFVYELMSRWAADSSPNVRRCVTNALMRYGIKQPRKVIALMDELRRDESEYVRKNVVFCLQQIAKEKHPILGPGNADNPDVMLAALREWAKDADKHNRWIVAGALGNVWARNRIPQAVEILRALAADGDQLVRGAVAASMRDLAKYDADTIASAAKQWANDASENVRQTGERALRKLV